MWTDTDAILAPILLGAVAALIVVRLTFRNAANVREAVISPAVFGLIGALLGIATGMILIADREGRVTIDKGVPVVICGATLGTLAGAGAQSIYSSLERGKAVTFVLVLMLLAGSVGAPLGWIVGAIRAGGALAQELNGDYEHTLKQFSLNGMMWGLILGASVGLLLGITEVLFRRREAT